MPRVAQKTAPRSASTLPSKTSRGRQTSGRRHESYKRYIFKVLKEVHPDMGISRKGMDVMEAFVGDMYNRVVLESARLTRFGQRSTMSAREVQTAVRLLLPGELSKHAVAEGTRAIMRTQSA
eukprot:jgi/Botrbrau1/15729/Bobra.4_1s0098.1